MFEGFDFWYRVICALSKSELYRLIEMTVLLSGCKTRESQVPVSSFSGKVQVEYNKIVDHCNKALHPKIVLRHDHAYFPYQTNVLL